MSKDNGVVYMKDFPSAFKKIDMVRDEGEITPRENFLRMLKGEKPVWMPTSMDIQTINPYCVPDNVARGGYALDRPLTEADKGGRDMFGLLWDFIPMAQGSMVRAGEELFDDVNEWKEKVVFPNPRTWDWEGAAKMLCPYIDENRAHESIIFNGLFERLISFMGMENACVAMIDEDQEDAIHELFSRLCDVYEEIILCLKEYFNLDIIQFHDDWGNQKAPFFHSSQMKAVIAPYVKRICDFCHKEGLLVHLHSCGHNDSNVEMMVECGIDCWMPQVTGDEEKLLTQFSPKMAIATHAKIDADSTDEELKEYAKKFVEHYAPMGRVFIFKNPFDMGNAAADAFYKYVYKFSKEYYASI